MRNKKIRDDLQNLIEQNTDEFADRKETNRILAERYFAPFQEGTVTEKLSPAKWRVASILSSLVFLISASLILFLQPNYFPGLYSVTNIDQVKLDIETSYHQSLSIEMKKTVNDCTLVEITDYINTVNNQSVMIRCDYKTAVDTIVQISVVEKQYKKVLEDSMARYLEPDKLTPKYNYKYIFLGVEDQGTLRMSFEKNTLYYYLVYPGNDIDAAADFLTKFSNK